MTRKYIKEAMEDMVVAHFFEEAMVRGTLQGEAEMELITVQDTAVTLVHRVFVFLFSLFLNKFTQICFNDSSKNKILEENSTLSNLNCFLNEA